MGELFLADRDKWFANRQDRQHKRHFEAADLLTATADRRESQYRFKSDKSDLKKINTSLQLIDDGHPNVSVFCAMRRVGFLDAAGSEDLRKLFKEFPALSNSIEAYVSEEKDWTGYYAAKISHSKH